MWIGTGPGYPAKFIADTEGEFANEEYKDMAGNLNFTVTNTAGESPSSNGLCIVNATMQSLMIWFEK